jgi:hypothetical protein
MIATRLILTGVTALRHSATLSARRRFPQGRLAYDEPCDELSDAQVAVGPVMVLVQRVQRADADRVENAEATRARLLHARAVQSCRLAAMQPCHATAG